MPSNSTIKHEAHAIADRSAGDLKALADLVYQLAKNCDDMERDVTQAKSDAASAKRDARR